MKHAAWRRKFLLAPHDSKYALFLPSKREAGRQHTHSLSCTRDAGLYAFEPEKPHLREPRARDRASSSRIHIPGCISPNVPCDGLLHAGVPHASSVLSFFNAKALKRGARFSDFGGNTKLEPLEPSAEAGTLCVVSACHSSVCCAECSLPCVQKWRRRSNVISNLTSTGPCGVPRCRCENTGGRLPGFLGRHGELHFSLQVELLQWAVSFHPRSLGTSR